MCRLVVDLWLNEGDLRLEVVDVQINGVDLWLCAVDLRLRSQSDKSLEKKEVNWEIEGARGVGTPLFPFVTPSSPRDLTQTRFRACSSSDGVAFDVVAPRRLSVEAAKEGCIRLCGRELCPPHSHARTLNRCAGRVESPGRVVITCEGGGYLAKEVLRWTPFLNWSACV